MQRMQFSLKKADGGSVVARDMAFSYRSLLLSTLTAFADVEAPVGAEAGEPMGVVPM